MYTFTAIQNGFSIINIPHESNKQTELRSCRLYMVDVYVYLCDCVSDFMDESMNERMKRIKKAWRMQRMKKILFSICSMMHCSVWQETIIWTHKYNSTYLCPRLCLNVYGSAYTVLVCLRSNPVGMWSKYSQ